MPCDTRLKRGQTISQRADEVRRAVKKIGDRLVGGSVKVKIGPQGAIAFDGVPETERDGVTDACMYRKLMSSGSAMARQRIAAAEQLAGRTVNKQAVAQGTHSHDGGKTWHDHKG